MDVRKVRGKLHQVLEQMKEADRIWCDEVDPRRSGHIPYPLKIALEMVDGLIERSPFHEGDRVSLKRTPEIGPDSGWRGCKHFLVQGAVGTVRTVEFYGGNFTFLVTFDDESWIDAEGKIHLANKDRPGHFSFSEDYLQLAGM